MKPHHKEIREKRAERRQSDRTNNSSRGNDRSIKAIKRNKRQLKASEVKIAAAKLSLKDRSTDEDNEDVGADDSNDGDAFGGSNENSSKKRRS